MSTVKDRGVIDLIRATDSTVEIIITDDMEWNFGIRQYHCQLLQDKINDYIAFIENGQLGEMHPGKAPVIKVMGEFAFSRYALDYMGRVKNFLEGKEVCGFEWGHADDKEYDDGFSDDFVFDIDKVYPRLRKNWAKKPLEEVTILPPSYPNKNAPDYSNQPMFRVYDSFVYHFMQDVGSCYTYLDYDQIPEGVDMNALADAAFKNLANNITYRMVDSKEKGIYGIVAGGDLEAEAILLDGLWSGVASEIGDDVIISIPTKDVVFFTKASDKKLIKKMLKMAGDLFEQNRKDTPGLLFCKDVFFYNRERNEITITDKYSL